MGRHQIRTQRIDRDMRADMLSLFGTARNAYRVLRLTELPYSDFYRALAWEQVKPETAEVIEFAWAQWSARFLQATRPTYPNADRFQFPIWDHLNLDASKL